MMINKRLIQAVPESKKYIALNVTLQWLSLAANIVMIGAIGFFLQKLLTKTEDVTSIVVLVHYYCGGSNNYKNFMHHWCCSYESFVFKICEENFEKQNLQQIVKTGQLV